MFGVDNLDKFLNNLGKPITINTVWWVGPFITYMITMSILYASQNMFL